MVSMLKKNLFYVLLVLTGLAAAYGYWTWQLDPYLVGIVESRRHPVGAREGGRIQEVLVATGSQVTSGQTLVRLDVSDLVAERDLLQEQLVSLETIMAADRQRYALEYDLLRLRVSQQAASVQADLAELNALNQEIQILQEAEAAGLGRGRDLARLLIRRDALRQSVIEQSALIERRIRTVPNDDPQADRDTVLTSLLGDRMERIHETLHRLTLIEQRLDYRIVKAPCEGRVVEITEREGNTIDAYQPILTVEDPQVSFVEAYVPEAQNRRLEEGQPVEVYSRRSDQFNTTGHIRFVHPGFSRMPERLWLRGQMLWVRKFRVELAPHHSLLPGESVRVRILARGGDEAGMSETGALSEQNSSIAIDGNEMPPGMTTKSESRKRRDHIGIGS
jgi:HlyD family secretion protein